MATYSKYVGTNYYAVGSNLLLLDSTPQSYTFTENKVYTDLIDNTTRLIYPERLRNAILSLYDSIPLKETLAGNTYYIGIDANDQNQKMPFYLGNRNHFGDNLVTTAALSSADVVLNSTNTESSIYTNSTVLAFLAGTDVPLMKTAPKIDSRVVINNDLTKRIDLSFANNNGQINVTSKQPGTNDPGATVSINGIGYPTVQNSSASASNNKVLSYQDGSMVWSETIPYDPGFYGATGTTVPILGNSTFVNGYSLEFTDERHCPIAIGGVALGQTFNEESLRDVLESIVYGYMPPSCTLVLQNQSQKYLEIGTYPVVPLRYSVTKKTLNTFPTALRNMQPNQLAPIVSDVSVTVEGTANGRLFLPLEKKTTVFEIIASDGTESTSASASVTGIYPIFYGLTSSETIDTLQLSRMNKIISEKKELKLDVFRSGILSVDKLYFIYDVEYGPLTSVIDPNGNDLIDAFDISAYPLSSPDGFWASKVFYVYKFNSFAAGYIGPYTVSSFITFKF